MEGLRIQCWDPEAQSLSLSSFAWVDLESGHLERVRVRFDVADRSFDSRIRDEFRSGASQKTLLGPSMLISAEHWGSCRFYDPALKPRSLGENCGLSSTQRPVSI